MPGAHPRSDTRILVVEDEAIVARDLTQRLEGLGYQVTGTAATGAEALALAHATRPTLVFMDITIQGPIDGVETAHRLIRQMDVPIIFLTAHTDTGTIQRAKQARCYGYLIKPFEERELISTLEIAVSRHGGDLASRLVERAFLSAGIGVIMVSALDSAHGITMCNPAFERMSGFTSAEILGRSPWFLLRDDPATAGRLRQVLDDRGECQVSGQLLRKEGASFRAEIVVSAVHAADGQATHSLLCVTDTSAREPAPKVAN